MLSYIDYRDIRLGTRLAFQSVWRPLCGADALRLGSSLQRHVAADEPAHRHCQGECGVEWSGVCAKECENVSAFFNKQKSNIIDLSKFKE